ncbi:hypothetical protein [Amycolatopsis nigrescens]|uniref:hypothetical protein n=1 Tax=Amycolatopsis nigrescens TaxID=381445 RepID=UPI0003A5D8A4|nr:hypothetical protein [Amycolatopsis nigrescens]
MSRSVLWTALLAAVVTAAALVSVVLLRSQATDHQGFQSAGEAVASGVTPLPGSECGAGPCQVLRSVEVHGESVELLADAEGGTGRVRIGGATSKMVLETSITALGVRLNGDSLSCFAAGVSACLVRGPHDGGMVGEVLVSREGNWRASEKPYFSDAGSIVLANVTGDDAAEVVRVQHECSDAQASAGKCQVTPVHAEVFDLGGKQVGCSRGYTSPSQIRGWPDIRLTAADLRPCP